MRKSSSCGIGLITKKRRNKDPIQKIFRRQKSLFIKLISYVLIKTMKNVLIVLSISLLWGTADLLRKAASGRASNQLISTVFNFGTVIVPLILLIYIFIKKQPIKYGGYHIWYAFLGGLLAGLGGFLLFYLLSKGLAVSTIVPVIRILNIVLVTVGGILLFSEPLTLKLIIGLVLAMLGVYTILS